MTSEEKLLKLIRQKNPSGQQDLPVVGEGKARAFVPLKVKKDGQNFDILPLFNKFLMVVCVGILGYMGIQYLGVSKKKQPAKSVSKVEVDPLEIGKITLPEGKSFSLVEQKLSQRNLFYNPWEKPEPKSQLAVDSNVEFIQQFKLVGIVLDADPKAIIEDIKSNQTFFLSKGEKINNAVVKEIREDKIILLYNNREVELTP